MPELPEVETTLRGIAPHIDGKKIEKVIIRQFKLRWSIHPNLAQILAGRKVLACSRRAKYLIITFETGIFTYSFGYVRQFADFLLLMMNVLLRRINTIIWILYLMTGTVLRYHDPRKFGAVLWYEGIAEHHPLLEKLGPEPLSDDFDANYLYQKLKTQKRAVKLALMDNTVVVGVGNIYANESLFKAGISPLRPANKLTKKECASLVETIKAILLRAIETGGSTLRDFVNSDGKSGYFQQEYTVYGRHNEPCVQCGGLIFKETLGQRGTFYCPNCQK